MPVTAEPPSIATNSSHTHYRVLGLMMYISDVVPKFTVNLFQYIQNIGVSPSQSDIITGIGGSIFMFLHVRSIWESPPSVTLVVGRTFTNHDSIRSWGMFGEAGPAAVAERQSSLPARTGQTSA